MKKSVNTGDKFVPIILVLFLLVIWQYAVEVGWVPRFILPSPLDIAKALLRILPDIKVHFVVTLKEAGIGYTVAVLFAVILAVLMDSVKFVRRAIYPLLIVTQTVPIVSLGPLFMIWFGLGILPKIVVVVLVCFFPIIISLLDGLASADRDQLNLLRSMGANRWQLFKYAKFPASMISFFSGLRIAATYSIMGAVIGEWLGGSHGLGIYMLRAQKSFALDRLFAAIAIIVALSLVVVRVISLLEYLVMPWSRISDENKGGN